MEEKTITYEEVKEMFEDVYLFILRYVVHMMRLENEGTPMEVSAETKHMMAMMEHIQDTFPDFPDQYDMGFDKDEFWV